MRVLHAGGRLDIQAAAIEAHALADESQARQGRIGRRRPGELDQARRVRARPADRMDGRKTDVLPVDDFGVRNGFRLAYGLKALPTPRALAQFGERWKPYRSTAAWYLWRAVDLARAQRLPPCPRAPRIALAPAAGKRARAGQGKRARRGFSTAARKRAAPARSVRR